MFHVEQFNFFSSNRLRNDTIDVANKDLQIHFD